MARYTVHYTEYKNCAEATELSRNSAIRAVKIGGLFFAFILFAMMFYIHELCSLFFERNITMFFTAIGILTILVYLYVLYLIGESIFVKAECQMLLLESERSPYLPIVEYRTIIKKNRWKKAARVLVVGSFIYVAFLLVSIAISGIVSGVVMGVPGTGVLCSSIVGLLITVVSFAIFAVLWRKHRKEISDPTVLHCRVCHVAIQEGTLCPRCLGAERALGGELTETERENLRAVAMQPELLAEETTPVVSVVENNTWICGGCKKRNTISSKRCWNCLSPFVE